MNPLGKAKKKISKKLLQLSENDRKYLVMYRKLNYASNRTQYLEAVARYSVMDNLILMEAMGGKVYGCNIKPLYEELIHNPAYSGYRIVWAFQRAADFEYLKAENPGLMLVDFDSPEHKIALARAKYIFTSTGLPEFYSRRKEQIYFQTWHGTPLKKLGCDIENDGGGVFTAQEFHKRYQHDVRRMSYLLAPSEYTAEKLSSAFGLTEEQKGILYKEGYPRNDFLYSHTDADILRIKNSLGIPPDKKVILYAPTFRDSDFKRGSGYFFEPPLSFKNLQKRYGNDCVLLFRPHVNVSSQFDLSAYSGFVYNVAKYPDISELYVISDLLITDYSSVSFDYANLRRPMIFYLYDLDEYQGNIRGLYFPVDDLPGEIVSKEPALMDAIEKQLYHFVYDEKYQAFNKKFNPWDGPDCSKRIIERIIPKLEAPRS